MKCPAGFDERIDPRRGVILVYGRVTSGRPAADRFLVYLGLRRSGSKLLAEPVRLDLGVN